MNINLNIADDWELGRTLERPIIISGPCSAETEEQVMKTCTQLANYTNVSVLRAGIWKPRTRPNSFEGIGSPALKWIKKAGVATGLPVTVEVANVKHVYEALRMGIDILWIGARTTVNPFAVQEIADALRGVDIPVLVKNPINPDLKLWIGALERLNQAGISKLGAIHRGFSTYNDKKYRNTPRWEIPIELMRLVKGMPFICDPSHICGRRDTLQEVSQKALDLNFDGLMIESHITPHKALSDAKQQVTPKRCGELLDSLVLRKTTTTDSDPVFLHSLAGLREVINELDHKLIDMLAERMKVAQRIGEVKRENNITILQAARWAEIIKSRMAYGNAQNLTDDFVANVYHEIHKESIRHQTKVMNNAVSTTKQA